MNVEWKSKTDKQQQKIPKDRHFKPWPPFIITNMKSCTSVIKKIPEDDSVTRHPTQNGTEEADKVCIICF